MRKFFWIFCVIAFPLFAEQGLIPKTIEEAEDTSYLIDFKGTPSSVVEGCVNVITGHYFEAEDDIVTPGPNPVIISRSFSSSNSEVGNLYDLWELNLESSVRLLDRDFCARIEEGNAKTKYNKISNGDYMKVSSKVLEAGVVNVCSPYASGRTHLKNKKLKILKTGKKKSYSLQSPGDDSLNYAFQKSSSRYLLSGISHANGCTSLVEYENGKISAIGSYSAQNQLLGKVSVRREKFPKRSRRITMTSDDGKEVVYRISRMLSKHRSNKGHHRYCLTKVERNFGPTTKYRYKSREGHKKEKLIRKEMPDGRFLKISYVGSGSHKGKVSALHAPVGQGEKAVPIQKFRYFKRGVSVTDAEGYKKKYKWDKQFRLTAIEDYLADKETLYRTEKLIWGKSGTKDHTLLKARLLQSPRGANILARTYTYDKRGNILEECLAGNLSGHSHWTPAVDASGVLISDKCERHVKTYTYSDSNLVSSERDSRKYVTYDYYPGTSLVSLKTISDGKKIRQRYYYKYDSNGARTLEIVDNGSSADIRDLSSVTERRIIKTENTKNAPIGLPKRVSEYYLDLPSKAEVLIKRTVNTYNRQGMLLKEEVYDSEDRLATTREWAYDKSGHVVEETDPLGQKSFYAYDANGNRTLEQGPNPDYRTEYTYDFANRLIKEEQVYNDGQRLSKTYAYDLKGNRIRATDIYGNETAFEYDCFDRLVKRVLPPVPDEEGNLVRPEEVFTYSRSNHPNRKTDAAGQTSVIKCNAYGNPSRVEHPDGTVEILVYNLDGTVKSMTDRAGTETRFAYDYQQRKIREEKVSPGGETLSIQEWVYDAFHLLHETDPEGNITSYAYDGAGRLVLEKKGDKETRYVYDSLGRQQQVRERCGEGWRISSVEYDPLDRIIEETVQSDTGELFLKKQYAYDVDGNRTHETVFSDNGPLTTVTYYDSRKQPVKIVSPDGSETLFHYRYDYYNQWQQCVPYEQAVDPRGNVLTTIRNAHDAVVVEERGNTYGQTTYRATYRYDFAGHLLRRTEDVIVEGERQSSQTVCFEHDAMGRETAIIEAFGTPEQKITRKEYNPFGEVSRLYKPDGTFVEQVYDALGRLAEVQSSDGSIHFRYAYDRNHNVTLAEDLCSGTVTERAYDAQGNMAAEILDHGQKLEYDYDQLGRLTSLTLPDLSHIRYGYDAGHLRTVARDVGGSEQAHTYHYDLSGKVSRVELMHQLGAIEYEYDACLRVSGIRSEQWQMKGEYDVSGNLASSTESGPHGSVTQAYGYDDLYQLTSESGAEDHEYQFDSLGNRVRKDQADCQSNGLNQLVKQGDVVYVYDRNGNLVEKSSSIHKAQYSYDALDRLVQVVDGMDKTVYTYDPFHRRTSKSRYESRSGQWVEYFHERYLYQGDKELGAVDSSGAITHLRVMGVGSGGDVGAAVLMEFSGQSYVPLHDYRGNVALLLDSTGQPVESYRYTAYGEERVYDSSGARTDASINPWRFSSKRVDPETGWNYFGRRYYDSETGRWTTPDPLWYVDGSNLYSYVKNRPTQFIDPQGLFLKGLIETVISTVLSVFEWAGSVDLNAKYEGEKAIVGVDIPLNQRGFDQRSHRIRKPEERAGTVHVAGVNGIWNDFNDAKKGLTDLEQFAEGVTSSWVYNATHGVWDVFEAILNFVGINTRPVYLLRKEFDEYFDNCPEDGILIIQCHSQGAILTRNALRGYDPERRQRIHVIAIGPAAYIDEDLCGTIQHIASSRDPVAWIDLPGRLRNKHTTQILSRHPKESRFFDHKRDSKTVQKSVETQIKFIRETYGDLR